MGALLLLASICAPEQGWLQPPQWARSPLMPVSQPSASLSPLQSANPSRQAPAQIPPSQVRVSMLLDAHDAPHCPQWSGLARRSRHHLSPGFSVLSMVVSAVVVALGV